MHFPVYETRTMIDFGLLVLIWLVQLIIYPSFRHIAPDAFTGWHGSYSMLISIFVIPLMFAQVAIIGYQLYTQASWAVWISAMLVVLIWLSTFLQAVPVHNLLGQQLEISTNVERLISVNWIRTVLWSVVFGLGWVRG